MAPRLRAQPRLQLRRHRGHRGDDRVLQVRKREARQGGRWAAEAGSKGGGGEAARSGARLPLYPVEISRTVYCKGRVLVPSVCPSLFVLVGVGLQAATSWPIRNTLVVRKRNALQLLIRMRNLSNQNSDSVPDHPGQARSQPLPRCEVGNDDRMIWHSSRQKRLSMTPREHSGKRKIGRPPRSCAECQRSKQKCRWIRR